MDDNYCGVIKILSASDVAKMLGLSLRTVRKLIKNGSLGGFRVGTGAGQWRFTENDILKYIENQRQNKN